MNDMNTPTAEVSKLDLPREPEAIHTRREELVLLKQRQVRRRVRLVARRRLGLLSPAPHVHVDRRGKLGLVRLELVRVREHHDGVVAVAERLEQPAQLVI